MADQVDGVLIVLLPGDLADVIALDQFHGQHPPGGMAGNDRRDQDPGLLFVELAEQLDVPGLVFVIQLFFQAFPDFCEQLVHGFLWHFQQAAEFERHSQLFQVRVAGFVYAGILDLDDHIGAIVQAGTVHLTDGCGRVRLFLEVLEQFGDRLPELGFDLLHDHLEWHWWRFFLQFFQGFREFPGQKILRLGGNLTDFHHGTLELPEGVGYLPGHAGIAFTLGAFVVLRAKKPASALTRILACHGSSHASELEEATTSGGNRFLCHKYHYAFDRIWV